MATTPVLSNCCHQVFSDYVRVLQIWRIAMYVSHLFLPHISVLGLCGLESGEGCSGFPAPWDSGMLLVLLYGICQTLKKMVVMAGQNGSGWTCL